MHTTLGEKIKFFRDRANISQFELEARINASSGSLCRIETDKVNPTKETLLEIAKVLELNVLEKAYLFGIVDVSPIEALNLSRANILKIR